MTAVAIRGYYKPKQRTEAELDLENPAIPPGGYVLTTDSKKRKTNYHATLTFSWADLSFDLGPKGDQGDDNFTLWLAAGNTGEYEDYLETLQGPPGTSFLISVVDPDAIPDIEDQLDNTVYMVRLS